LSLLISQLAWIPPGAPIEEQVFTTIFRTKGLEFDYVLLPETNEGVMPYLAGIH
jgi:superfamily I DNA/RNA helicase